MATGNISTVSELQTKLTGLNNDPSSIQRIILEELDGYYNGAIQKLDPTNPFIYLMGVSCVNSSINLQESVQLLREQYPSLAITYEQLYKHMSDRDYLGIYSNPSLGKFRFMVYLNMFDSVAVTDNINNCTKVTIPRNTEITLQNITFSLQYPVDIRKFSDGSYEVLYVDDQVSPIQPIGSLLIPSNKITRDNIENWLMFDVELLQLLSLSTELSIDNNAVFKDYVALPSNLNYYYARVYTSINGQWVEIKTTLTSQVYDPTAATAVLTLLQNKLQIFIPSMYITNNKVSNLIRVDTFLTNGVVNLDPSEVAVPDGYKLNFKYNDLNDGTPYVSAINSIPVYAYATDKISGGNSGYTFNQLRNKVIFNSIGKQTSPITNAQLQSYAGDLGYTINMNLNILTNRLFTVSKALPQPSNINIIKPAQPTLLQYSTTLDKLLNQPNVQVNGPIYTIYSNNFFSYNNGKISLLSKTITDSFNQMLSSDLVSLINNGSYFYNPFYYVIDTTEDVLSIRPYHLDNPQLVNQKYVMHNNLSNIDVTTGATVITKTANGYNLKISTSSTIAYKTLPDANVGAQLSFNPIGSTRFVSIEGTLLYTDTNGERVYSFNINTNYKIDVNNYLSVINGTLDIGSIEEVQINLKETFFITYYTNSIPPSYVIQPNDGLINQYITGSNLQKMLITRDSVDITLGYFLDGLWAKYRTYLTSSDYEVYTQNVPATYANDVLAINPTNNTPIFFDANNKPYVQFAHKAGDPILDNNNKPVLLHKAGDIILDSNGNPTSTSPRNKVIDLYLLLIDACYLLATDNIYKKYTTEITNNLLEYITVDVPYLNDLALEKTKIYYSPFITKGNTNVLTINDDILNIEKEQNINVNIYVNANTYDNLDARNTITKTVTQMVVDAISQKQIIVKDIENAIQNQFPDSITTVYVDGLGGLNDFKAITLINNNDQLSIKYKLELLNDGTLTVGLGVNISYLKYNT